MSLNLFDKGKIKKTVLLFVSVLMLLGTAFAQKGGAAAKSSLSEPLVLTMVIIMVILLLIIGLLAYVVVGAAHYFREKQKTEGEGEKIPQMAVAVSCTIALVLFAPVLFAQDTTAPETVKAVTIFGGLSKAAFYCLIGVLVTELLVIFVLLSQLRGFIAAKRLEQKVASASVEYKAHRRISLWDKFNKLRPIEQEAQIDLGHDYDGIRELDNRLPPWWLYGFYLTIIIGAIYLWRYHVSHTAPSSEQEFQFAMRDAELQKQEYLRKSANNVDENTVIILTEANALESGKALFIQNCAACHGKEGEGTVGPNLTDDYWLHGGSVKDVFKSIKYGWPEKGMRSWKEDFSPSQLVQITSFIKNLQGSNPLNAKEKQGDRYEETTSSIVDSSINPVKSVGALIGR